MKKTLLVIFLFSLSQVTFSMCPSGYKPSINNAFTCDKITNEEAAATLLYLQQHPEIAKELLNDDDQHPRVDCSDPYVHCDEAAKRRYERSKNRGR